MFVGGKLGKSVVRVTVAWPWAGVLNLIVGAPIELQSGLVAEKKVSFSGWPDAAYLVTVPTGCAWAAVVNTNVMATGIAVHSARRRQLRLFVCVNSQLEARPYFIVPSPHNGGTIHNRIIGANAHAVNHPKVLPPQSFKTAPAVLNPRFFSNMQMENHLLQFQY
jgi:hypothetical protein